MDKSFESGEMRLSDQLFEAVGEGDFEKVKQLLLNQGADVNLSPRNQVYFLFLSFSFCGIDLKLKIERGYSFDESMSNRRLKNGHFVD